MDTKYLNTPTIGIYLLPGMKTVPSNYVKWIESAGGHVIALSSDISEAESKKKFLSLNGLLFIGRQRFCPTSITPSAFSLFCQALESNKQGRYFPVWGTCLGFQWILQMIGNMRLDHGLDAVDYALPLEFTEYGKNCSQMFSDAPCSLMKILSTEKVTYNHHRYGVSPTTFYQNRCLTNFFYIVSTNKDRKDKCFISMFEGKHFPIYGSQWHPEKNAYEFSTAPTRQNVPHDCHARLVSYYLANFFVKECRKSFITQTKQNQVCENSIFKS